MGKEWDKIRAGPTRKGNPFDASMNIGAAPEPERGNPWASERKSYGAPNRMPKCALCGKWKYNGSKASQCACVDPQWVVDTWTYPRKMQDWHHRWAEAAYRVAKPSAYLLAFGGTRTVHRMTVALEDAGWIIRDMLVYAYASGFPKSLNVSKASRARSWGALLQDADRSSGKGEGSPAGYPAGCRLCGQPLRSVSVVVQDGERLSSGAPRCSHPSAPSVDIPLGNGRSYRVCLDELSCRPSTPDCVHRASARQGPRVVLPTTDAEGSRRTLPDDGLGLLPLQRPDADTPGRSSDVSPSEATPHTSGTPSRTAHSGQSKAYTHYTVLAMGCLDCHTAYAGQEYSREGWGTALKPAWEPIVMARKPGPGSVVDTVLRIGTGALNIDGCRIGAGEGGVRDGEGSADRRYGDRGIGFQPTPGPRGGSSAGRFPSNVILTDPIFDGGVEGVVGGGEAASGIAVTRNGGGGKWYDQRLGTAVLPDSGYGDSGTYSRFFLVPKSSREDREPVIRPEWAEPGKRASSHPTVKPTELMRHLVRLVTPPGGTVLDPFLGSGSTGIAAELEGFPWIGIEKEREYVAIAEARLNGTQRGLGLDVPAPVSRPPNTHPDLSKHQPKRRAPGENYSGRWAGTDEEVPA